jgi:hypothetical protein
VMEEDNAGEGRSPFSSALSKALISVRLQHKPQPALGCVLVELSRCGMQRIHGQSSDEMMMLAGAIEGIGGVLGGEPLPTAPRTVPCSAP